MSLTRIFVTAAVSGLLVLGVCAPAAAATAEHTTAIQLSWDGSGYSDATTESFVGFPVAVPGDSVSRTLQVRNDGPSNATLRVSIVNVDLLRASTSDSFYDDLRIDWTTGRSSIKDLDDAGTTRIMEVPLAKGKTTPVTIGYDFPAEATSGNASKVGARSGSFDVLLELGGETAGSDSSGSSGATSDPNASSDPGASSTSRASSDPGASSDSTADTEAGAVGDQTSRAEAGATSASDANSDARSNGDASSEAATLQDADATAAAAGVPDASADEGFGGFLPRTGGATWWAAVLGAVLAGTGAALVRIARRRTR